MARKQVTMQEALEGHDKIIGLLCGHVAGLNKAISLLISTHPNPAALRAAWQALLPLHVESEMDSAVADSDPYREGVQGAMAIVSRCCDDAAGIR